MFVHLFVDNTFPGLHTTPGKGGGGSQEGLDQKAPCTC